MIFLESGNILNSNVNHDFVEFLLKGSDEANPVGSDDETDDVSDNQSQNVATDDLNNTITNDDSQASNEQVQPIISGSNVDQSQDGFDINESQSNTNDESTQEEDSEWYDSSMSEADITVISEPRRTKRASKPVERFEAGMCAIIGGSVFEPTTVEEALNCDQRDEWKAAMTSEYESLLKNNTWELTELPPGCKAIRNKWVFRVKRDAFGNITRYKARFVAKGCSQRAGIDYKETFSPVVRYSSIRFLMALAVKYELNIEQMDAVTAFLQGDVEETIYMSQPEIFDDNTGRVCKLKRSIYGLKQASRQWNLKLSQVLISCGYKQCATDSCIYIRREKQSIVIVAVYVDDLLILWNNSAWKTDLKNELTSKFCMKDLGKVSNILGIRIEHNKQLGTISMDQQKYTKDILNRFNMSDCNPVKTPVEKDQHLSIENTPKTSTEIDEMKNVPYRSILHLSQCTRPDISFAVGVVSRFNHNPGKTHWNAVKRIFRHLKGTIDYKITFSKDKSPELSAFCDSDWGSNVDDRKSISGYLFMWYGCVISWASKKQPTVLCRLPNPNTWPYLPPAKKLFG